MACNVCEREGKLSQCARCKTVSYCSKECQKYDWKAHKSVCKAPGSKAEPRDTSTTVRPPILSVPNEILIDIFRFCPTLRTAQALAASHSTLYNVFKANDVRIHTALANTTFGPLIIRILQSGHPDRMPAKTQYFLASCADGIVHGPALKHVLNITKGDYEAACRIFPYFWRQDVGLWKPINGDVYRRMSFEFRTTLWDLYFHIFQLDRKPFADAYRQMKEDAAKPRSTPCTQCFKTKAEPCYWHLDHYTGARQEEIFHFEFSKICQGDNARGTNGGFSTPVLWEAFLHYVLFFISSAYPLPKNYPPEFASFNCTTAKCEICNGSEFGWRLHIGGDHVWDYSVTETLTETQIKALRYLHNTMAAREVQPFRYPYRIAAEQSFHAYWDVLKDYGKVDPVTGKLVDVDQARKEMFGSSQMTHYKAYWQKEIEVETASGKKMKRTIVEDQMAWEDFIWERKELIRRHQGLERRPEWERFEDEP
ncbi:hypothetical protein BJ508DRAFT_307159 [Ascobolus immersus RN42]|uniref:MYND-type domain-containing protein n=1 Tax=Ascobolus immersus RN42 TaxID=1160509 RepID=A0A3N4I5I1_ASCIM|nr:hypothetical protein BJ508DRAFT_307159 [Ascobolus immersus RN42]